MKVRHKWWRNKGHPLTGVVISSSHHGSGKVFFIDWDGIGVYSDRVSVKDVEVINESRT